MNKAIPNCLVENHEGLIDGLQLPDPADRHVLAAAIVGGSDVITVNLLAQSLSRVESLELPALPLCCGSWRAESVSFPAERSKGARGQEGVIPGEPPPGRAFGAPEDKLHGEGRGLVIPGEASAARRGKGIQVSSSTIWIPFPRIASRSSPGMTSELHLDCGSAASPPLTEA